MPKNTQAYQLPPAPSMSIPFGSPLSTMGLGGTGQNVSHSPFMGSNLSAYGVFPDRDTSLQPIVAAPASSSPATTAMGPKAAAAQGQAQMPAWWNPGLANTSSGFYKPPNQNNLNQYLQNLYAGWSINPKTGQAASPAQALGKAGGSPASYAAHKGILDPVSAQAAIQQFQQGLAGGSIVPGSTPGTYVDPNWTTSGGYYSMMPGGAAPPGPQTTNFFNPQYSQPGQMQVQQGLTAKPNDAMTFPGLAYTAQGQPIYAPPPKSNVKDYGAAPTSVNLSQLLPGQSFDTLAAARNYTSPTGGHFDALGNWRP